MTDKEIKARLMQASVEVKAFLPKGSLTEEASRRLLGNYVAAIEGNFIAWMGAAALTARSIQGRYAAEENLSVEIRDNHAGMLRAFAKAATAEPSLEHFRLVSTSVEDVRSMVSEMSGLKNLALMAMLENTSAEFIPLLEKLAIQLGSTDLAYTKIHGEADVMHADQFAWALGHEMQHYEDAESLLDSSLKTSTDFLRAIFTSR